MRKLTVGILIAFLAVSAGAYYRYARNGPAPQVTTAPLTRGDIVEAVAATGIVQAVTTVQVGTQVSGTISALHADFNSIVRKGQVIATLEPSLFQTQVEQARANVVRSQADVERLQVALDDARDKLRRAEDLAAKQLLPASDLETARVNARAAEAQVKSAQAQIVQARAGLNQSQVNLQHTVIHAPIDGIVISRNVDVGQTVAASMQAPTLFVIAADLTKMQVVASVDEADVGRMRPGQTTRFRVDAFPTEEFVGTVAQVRLQPVVQQNVVTYNTVIDVPNPELKLKPGMTSTVNIEIARRADVIRVPNGALRFRPTREIFDAFGQVEPPPGPNGTGRPTGSGSAAPGGGGSSASTPPATPRSSPPAFDGGPSTDRLQRFRERLQGLPPEERERIMARMRERGGSMRGERRSGVPPPPRPELVEGPSPAQGGPAPEARTIDALFGPTPPTESSGRVWLFVGGQLKPVRVRLGISDGVNTELLSGELQEGAELVAAVSLGSETRGGSTGRSPLTGPQRPGFGGGGGRGPQR